jgi:filamentous hemagglutinin family protein
MAAAGFLLSVNLCAQTHTVIKTDTNWGRAAQTLSASGGATAILGTGGTSYRITGNVFTIPESLGKSAGSNLFHSFEHFSVGAGDAAIFTTTSAYANVISRISGLSQSAIDGLMMLRPAQGTHPNFFFINPNGVTFGQGAQIDVPAAIHISTADRLTFADGFVWSASTPSASSMSIAAPESFGFLSKIEPGVVSFNNRNANGIRGEQQIIALTAGSELNVVAGAVQLDSINISIPEGLLQLRATGNQAIDVPIKGNASARLTGTIDLIAATLSTAGNGDIILEGGPMTLTNSAIRSNNAGDRQVGALTFKSSGDIALKGTSLLADTTSASTDATFFSIILDAAGRVSILDGSQVSTLSSGAGVAGSVKVDAQAVRIDGTGATTGIMSRAEKNSSGNAGDISVGVTGDVAISGNAQISSITQSSGKAGDITITAHSLALEGNRQSAATGVFSNAEAGSGNAGKIQLVMTDRLDLQSGAQISSNTKSQGAAGEVNVTARTVSIDGGGVTTAISSSAEFGSAGHVGQIKIEARDALMLQNQGRLDIANHARVGVPVRIDGGLISVDSPSIVLTGGSQITAETTGNVTGANILLQPARNGRGDLSIRGDGTGAITSSINVPPNNRGGKSFRCGSSFCFIPPTGNADAGNIDIRASNARLSGVTVKSDTSLQSVAPAGKIALSITGNLSILDNTSITTNTAGRGLAGDVTISDGGILLLDHSQITTSGTATQSGNGGNIDVTARALVMNTGFIQANARARGASGGNVVIDAGTVVASGTLVVGSNALSSFTPGLNGLSVIQAAAPDGVSGNISLSAPVSDIAGKLKRLSGDVIEGRTVSRDLCRVGAGSSLTPMGRGGMRPTALGFVRPEVEMAVLANVESPKQRLAESSAIERQGSEAYRCEQ